MFATLEAKLLGAAVLIVFALGAFGTYTFHERAVGKANELASLQKSSAKLIAEDDAKIAELTKKYLDATAQLLEHIDEDNAVDAARRKSDDDRLRQFNAYRDQLAKLQGASKPPGAPSQGASGTGQSEDFIGELGFAGVSLADALRDTSVALSACMTDRDSVTSGK